MDKNKIKKYLKDKFLSEADVPGLSVTNKNREQSGKFNKQGIKDINTKVGQFEKSVKQDPNSKQMPPNKYNYDTDFQKTYHDEMEILNGQEMIQYDREPNKRFVKRALDAIEGSSEMGNNPEWANVYPKQLGFSGPEFGKNLVKNIKNSIKKRGLETPAISLRGKDIQDLPTDMIDNGHKPYAINEDKKEYKKYSIDRIESSGMYRAKSKNVGYLKADTLAGLKKLIDNEIEKTDNNKTKIQESMKRLNFKKPFNGVGNALKLIPESYRVNNKIFEMTDGDESYKIRWEGSLTEGKAVVLMASDKNLVNEDMQKMKHLMGYRPQDTFGNLKGKERINENKEFSNIWGKTKELMSESEENDGGSTKTDNWDETKKSAPEAKKHVKGSLKKDSTIAKGKPGNPDKATSHAPEAKKPMKSSSGMNIESHGDANEGYFEDAKKPQAPEAKKHIHLKEYEMKEDMYDEGMYNEGMYGEKMHNEGMYEEDIYKEMDDSMLDEMLANIQKEELGEETIFEIEVDDEEEELVDTANERLKDNDYDFEKFDYGENTIMVSVNTGKYYLKTNNHLFEIPDKFLRLASDKTLPAKERANVILGKMEIENFDMDDLQIA